MTLALDRLKPLLDSFREEIAYMGNFPSLFLATVNHDGGLEYYDGTLRMVDGEGNMVAEGLDPASYSTYLGEASEDSHSSNSPSTGRSDIRPGTTVSGRWRASMWPVSPVPTRADRELREFKQRGHRGPAPSASRSTTTWRG